MSHTIPLDGSRAVVYMVLAYLALTHRSRAAHPCIEVSKAELIRAYHKLRRSNIAPSIKIETFLRTVRAMASEAKMIHYTGRRGVYRLCIPSVESHPLWPKAYNAVARLALEAS